MAPHAEMHPHDAQPVHSASKPAPHHLSYYDEMFGTHHDGLNYHDMEAHYPMEGHSNPATVGHLDETPYEHAHSDFDARFREHDPIPHDEVKHDAHGIEGHFVHDEHAASVPSYEELLWAY